MEPRRDDVAYGVAEEFGLELRGDVFLDGGASRGDVGGGDGVDPVFFGVFGGGVEVVDKAWGVPPGVVPFGGDRGRSEGVGVDLVG